MNAPIHDPVSTVDAHGPVPPSADMTLLPPEEISPRWLRTPLRLLWAFFGGLFLMRQVALVGTMAGVVFSPWVMVTAGVFGILITHRCRVQLVATRPFRRR